MNVWHTGEDAAAEAYRRQGYRIVARNWTCPLGELDLVVAKDGRIVFCEVKSRRGTAYGEPYEAVTLAKQRKLRALAEAFVARQGQAPGGYRFDVASIRLRASGAQVDVYEDAF